MPLVITSWYADTQPTGEDRAFIRIIGRQGGLGGFFLSVLGIEPTTTLAVTRTTIFLQQGSLAGFSKHVIPIRCLTSVFYGYTKPWRAALWLAISVFSISCCCNPLPCLPLMGAGAAIQGDGGQGSLVVVLFFVGLVLLLLGPVLGLLYYFFNKTLSIALVEGGGVISSIEFKRSIIEGQEITEDDARKLTEILRALLEEAGKDKSKGP